MNCKYCKTTNKHNFLRSSGKYGSTVCTICLSKRSSINNPMRGKTHSKKAKDMMSNARKKIVYSDKWKKNIGLSVKKRLSTKKSRIKLGKSCRQTSKYYYSNYPIFCKEEEIRDNPSYTKGKPGIQVKCKLCKKWFTPTRTKLTDRICAVDHYDGKGGNYLYCSDKCKDNCPLFNLKSDPNKEDVFVRNEYNIWKREVFKRQHDKYGKNFCEYCESQLKLACHHIYPKKLYPLFALDPDNGLICCQACHFNKAHIDECNTSKIRMRNCNG